METSSSSLVRGLNLLQQSERLLQESAFSPEEEELILQITNIAKSAFKEQITHKVDTNLGISIAPYYNYLNEEGKIKTKVSAGGISREDFDPSQLSNVEKILRDSTYDKVHSKCIEQFNQDIQNKDPRCKIDTLKQYKRMELELVVCDLAKETSDKRVTAFLKGSSFREIAQIFPDKIIRFPTTLEDYTFCRSSQTSLTNTQLRTDRQKGRLQLRVREKKEKNFFRINNECLEAFNRLTDPNAHLCQLRWFRKTAQKLNVPIHMLETKNLSENDSEINGIIQDILAKALIAEEEAQPKPTLQLRKSKNKKKKAASEKKQEEDQSKLEIEEPTLARDARLDQLNCSRSSLKLKSRITRWNTNDLTRIKSFVDKGADGIPVKRYSGLSSSELEKMRDYHNLSGIERVLANKEMQQKYSFSYEYKAPRSEKMQTGLALYAQLQRSGKIESGIVYVGINQDDVIYHAQFEPFDQRHIRPRNLPKVLDNYASQDDETKWELSSNCSFSFEANDVIKMEIGKSGKNRVIYRFFPLDSEAS